MKPNKKREREKKMMSPVMQKVVEILYLCVTIICVQNLVLAEGSDTS